MSTSAKLSRRQWLRLTGASLALLPTTHRINALTAPQTDPVPDPSLHGSRLIPAQSSQPDVEIALRAVKGEATILPGPATQVEMYRADVLRGDPSSVQTMAGSYVGPILRLRKGQQLRIHFTNALEESTVVHWHGVHVPERVDGHPRDALQPGASKVYDFTVINHAGTYWFHPHPLKRTEAQVYMGLAGLFIVGDDDEAKIGLPAGPYGVPLVLQDRIFDRNK